MNTQKKKFSAGMAAIYLVLAFWTLTTICPIFWVIINSFKAKEEILPSSFTIPVGEVFTLANYRTAFGRLSIFSAYRSSMIISPTVADVVILLAGMASFALVRYDFKLRKPLNSLAVVDVMFPVFSTIILVFRMLSSWHMVSTKSLALSLISMALPQIAGNLSFAIVVLAEYIHSLPTELEESAYLEGYSPFQIFFKIVVPSAKPSFATVAIFSFLWSYGDLFTQMFLLWLPQHRAITRLLNELMASEGTNFRLMATSVALVIIPVLVVYTFLQKYIIKGVTAGAVRG